jgi:hypothetical protein
VLLIPLMLAVMIGVRRHFRAVTAEIASDTPVDLAHLSPPLVVVALINWNKVSQKALRFAYTLSKDVRALHITSEEESDNVFCRDWAKYAEAPARAANVPVPELVVIPSPYRFVLRPIVDISPSWCPNWWRAAGIITSCTASVRRS